MNTLLCRTMVIASLLAASAICRAQSNVYSINGISADSFLPAQHRPDELEIWSCNYGLGGQGVRVEWYVSTNALAKQPRWDGLSVEVPLSARKACTLALASVRKRLPQVQVWSVESVLLHKPYSGERDVWCYQITFTPGGLDARARKDYQAGYYAVTQIVLFDGTVVPQTVLKRK